MVNTVDFITPPVDDPYWFGQIAAANSLSDIYAMGARPLTALNVVMFPAKKLDMTILQEILRGGNDKVMEAGACLVGGHSVDDEEPKYGLCVNGVVHPERIITNSGARPGDGLILTKPLGSGVLFNAVRSGKLPFAALEQQTLPCLGMLNGTAMAAALSFDLHAATDITGFGIVGHALEMAEGSGVRIMLEYGKLPFYPEAEAMYAKGESTGSNKANRHMTANCLDLRRKLSRVREELLFDPQTSGGVLLAVPDIQVEDLLAALRDGGVQAATRIGEVADGPPGIVVI
jgi:selenide,water dikinase